jgi:hypothetical protein
MNAYEGRFVPIVTIFGFRESGHRVVALEHIVGEEPLRFQRVGRIKFERHLLGSNSLRA